MTQAAAMPGAAQERPPLPVPVRTRPPRVLPPIRPHGLAAGELVKLHHSLAEALRTDNGVVCQFIAPESTIGTEQVVYDLAYISAAWLGKRVLFVNGSGNRLDPRQKRNGTRHEPELPQEPGADVAEQRITRVVGLNLYHMNMPGLRGAVDLAPTLKRLPAFLSRVRETFDLVLIASPPAAEAPVGMLLSRFVDGNVLVLEAGRTRAPVAAELRNSIAASGGAVIGAVLTQYKSAAPRWLRRWL